MLPPLVRATVTVTGTELSSTKLAAVGIVPPPPLPP